MNFTVLKARSGRPYLEVPPGYIGSSTVQTPSAFIFQWSFSFDAENKGLSFVFISSKPGLYGRQVCNPTLEKRAPTAAVNATEAFFHKRLKSWDPNIVQWSRMANCMCGSRKNELPYQSVRIQNTRFWQKNFFWMTNFEVYRWSSASFCLL